MKRTQIEEIKESALLEVYQKLAEVSGNQWQTFFNKV